MHSARRSAGRQRTRHKATGEHYATTQLSTSARRVHSGRCTARDSGIGGLNSGKQLPTESGAEVTSYAA